MSGEAWNTSDKRHSQISTKTHHDDLNSPLLSETSDFRNASGNILIPRQRPRLEKT